MLNFRALKISRKRNKFVCALFAELSGQDMRALSSDTTAKLKISNPNKSFDHLLHLKSGVRPPPSRQGLLPCFGSAYDWFIL